MSGRLRLGLVVSIVAVSGFVLLMPRFDPVSSFGQTLADLVVSEAVGLAFLVTGLLAWQRRPANRTGLLMMVVGFAWFIETVAHVPTPAAFTLGAIVLPTIYLPALAHLMLAYPDGRLRLVFERILVIVMYVGDVAISIACHLFTVPSPGPCPYCIDLIAVRGDPPLNERIREVSAVVTGVFTIGVVVVIVARWLSLRGWARRAIAPVFWTSAAAGLFVVLLGIRDTWLPGLPAAFYLYGYLTLMVLPVAFLVGLLRVRLARSAVGGVLVELGSRPDLTRVRAALARALADPGLEIGFRTTKSGAYLDTGDRPLQLPDEQGRAITAVGPDGDTVLVHDAALRDEPRLLRAAVAAAGLAVDHARPQQQAAAQSVQARVVGQRIVQAGDAERRRLERNLHDGAQQRLVAGDPYRERAARRC